MIFYSIGLVLLILYVKAVVLEMKKEDPDGIAGAIFGFCLLTALPVLTLHLCLIPAKEIIYYTLRSVIFLMGFWTVQGLFSIRTPRWREW